MLKPSMTVITSTRVDPAFCLLSTQSLFIMEAVVESDDCSFIVTTFYTIIVHCLPLQPEQVRSAIINLPGFAISEFR